MKFSSQSSFVNTYQSIRFLHSIFQRYLAARECSNFLELISRLIEVTSQSTKFRPELQIFTRFNFIRGDRNKQLLKTLAVNIEDYKNTYSASSQNYKGLKQYPLLEFKDNYFVCLNFDNLFKKLHTGIVFDFYYQSGIELLPQFSKFDKFKSFFAKEFSEQRLFKYLIKKCFPNKHKAINFSEAEEAGEPDSYIREGNNVFIIEFKDYIASDNLVLSDSFEKIKQDINTKFIENKDGKPKGITQLLNNIKKLIHKPFEWDDYVKKGIKQSSLKIYPLIIHTCPYYQMVDVNDYLNDIFKTKLDAISSEFQDGIQFSVNNVCLIDLQTIFRFHKLFEEKQLKVHELIDRYFTIKQGRIKKFTSFKSGDNFLKAYSSIEDVLVTARLPEYDFASGKWIRSMLSDIEVLSPE